MAKKAKKATTATMGPNGTEPRPSGEKTTSAGGAATAPVHDPPPDPSPTPAVEATPPATVFAFPSRSRCPRCGTVDTVALSTQGDVQYRRCLRAICRKRYAVRGERV